MTAREQTPAAWPPDKRGRPPVTDKAYRYYILTPRPGATPADAARAVQEPALYWTITGRARTSPPAAPAGSVVVYASTREMAMSRARDRSRARFAAAARTLALTDLAAGHLKPGAAAVGQAMGLPRWAVSPALSALIYDAYQNALQEHCDPEGATRP